MSSPFWPLFGLTLSTPRLTLRPPTDEDFEGLFDAVDAGIHDPDVMPFSVPWTDAEPTERRLRSAQFWWGQRAGWGVDEWHLPFAVFLDGKPVGIQEVFAKRFLMLGEVSTGSWLTRSAQGRGLGKEMRVAVLRLAFEGLGAEVARTAAFEDNVASLTVSRSIGYRENGRYREASRGEPRVMIHFEMTRQEWTARQPVLPPAEIFGLEACRHMFHAPTWAGGDPDGR
jgi:RimJ/RimL family protein N-acetyltransferase